MKKITILAAIAFVFALASCNKAKDCKCTSVQEMSDMDPITAVQTLHIEKGECSDGNTTTTMDMGGEQMTQTTTCVEI